MAAKLPVEERQEAPRRADFDLIRELAALLSETGLSEIEIGEGPDRIRVARKLMGSTVAVVPAAAPLAETLAADANDAQMTATVDANHPGAVISPLVGVVYHAPEPGADIFVKVGDSVSLGDPIARAGSSGAVTGPHLHYEVIRDGKKSNPMDFITL